MQVKWFSTRLAVVLVVAIGWSGLTQADVRLPKIFSDNMMLQRDQPIRVWG